MVVRATVVKEIADREPATTDTTGESPRSLSEWDAGTGLPHFNESVASVKQTLNIAGERLREGAHQVQEFAGELWHGAQHKVHDLRERAAEVIEKHRIERALGRRVNRVILDSEDEIILNESDVITHEAIEQAREAGVLKMLLDSVDGRRRELAIHGSGHTSDEPGNWPPPFV